MQLTVYLKALYLVLFCFIICDSPNIRVQIPLPRPNYSVFRSVVQW